MLGFLNALFLTGLVAAAIPVVIHLLNRRRTKKIRFSSLEFLSEVSRRRMRKINLRRILVLILRTLAVLFLVLAFARPTLRGVAALLPGKAPKAVVVALDNSFSMGLELEQGTLFDRARGLAADVVDEANGNDVLNLVTFASRPEASLERGTRNHSLIRNALRDAAVSHEATSIGRAVAFASELVTSSDIGVGEVYVISDFRYNRDTTLVPEGLSSDDVRVYLVPVQVDDADNVSIDRVMVPRKLLRAGELIRVSAVLTNHSTQRAVEVPLELRVGEARKAEKVVTLSPSATTSVAFPISFNEAGLYNCTISKNRDRLPVDDTRHFVVDVSKSVPVTLVRGRRTLDGDVPSAAGFFYLEKALNPRTAGDAEFVVRTIDERDLVAASLPRRGVVVWVNPQKLPNSRMALLERHVQRGGGLLIFLGNGDRQLLSDQRFADFVGFKSAARRSTGAVGGYTSFQKEHPVFALFNDEELELLARTRVSDYVSVRGVAPDSILAYVAAGDPAIWEVQRGQGKILVCAAAPDLQSGDLPLSPMFLPMVHTSVSYLASAGDLDRRGEDFAGEAVYLDAPEDVLSSSALVVRDPQGQPIRPAFFETPQGTRRVVIDRPTEVGVYGLYNDTTLVTHAVVNVDARESNLTVSTMDTNHDAVAVVSADEGFTENLRAQRQGREIFAFFLLLSAVALAAESILGRHA